MARWHVLSTFSNGHYLVTAGMAVECQQRTRLSIRDK